MTPAQIQTLIDACRTSPTDLVTWLELKAVLEALKNQDLGLTLTTTGTSGAATLDIDTDILNIPNYSTDITGLVPYTGANQNVNLGEYGIRSGWYQLDLTPTGTPTSASTMYWDDNQKTVALVMGGTTQKIGHDQFYHAKNSTGTTIPKGTAVRFAGTDGGSGHLLITPFLADGSNPSSYFMGVTAEEITNGSFGKVQSFGRLDGIDTSAFAEGDLLYCSTTVAGGFQTTVPQAPNNIILVAAVISDSNNGKILIRPTLGSKLSLDESVRISSPTNGQVLQYNSSLAVWQNATLSTSNVTEGTNLYYTDTRARGAISLTTTGSGAATYNSSTGVLNIPTPSSVNIYSADGTLTGNRTVTSGGFSLTFTGSNTASGAIARGLNLTHTLVAAANNDVLVGLDINPTFSNGAFTGVTNAQLRLVGTTSPIFRSLIFSAGDATGNAYITADPSSQLNISGSFGGIFLRFGTTSVVNVSSATLFRPAGDNSVDNGNISNRWRNVWAVTVNADTYTFQGNVGLALNSNPSTGIRFDYTNNQLTFLTNSGTALRIFNNQNIGINTTTDAGFRLDVNGTMRVQGNATITGDLISGSTNYSNNNSGIRIYQNPTTSDPYFFFYGNGPIATYAMNIRHRTDRNGVVIGSNTGSNLTLNGDGTPAIQFRNSRILMTANSETPINIGFFNTGVTQPTRGIFIGHHDGTGFNSWFNNDAVFIGIIGDGAGKTSKQYYFGAAGYHVGGVVKSNVNITFNGAFPNAGTFTDAPGGDFTIAGGRGSGAGLSGDVIFATANAGTSGNALQTLVDRWWVKGGTGQLANVSAPDASAVLQMNSTTQGVLLPRMTTTQRNAIASPATGLMVYDTTGNTLDVYNGTQWLDVLASDFITIDNTNNRLGINTASPNYDLHVTGTSRITGNTEFSTASGAYMIVGATGDTSYRLSVDGDLRIYGNIRTAQPTGGTGVEVWRLGSTATGTFTMSTSLCVEVEIGGTLYKLATVS